MSCQACAVTVLHWHLSHCPISFDCPDVCNNLLFYNLLWPGLHQHVSWTSVSVHTLLVDIRQWHFSDVYLMCHIVFGLGFISYQLQFEAVYVLKIHIIEYSRLERNLKYFFMRREVLLKVLALILYAQIWTEIYRDGINGFIHLSVFFIWWQFLCFPGTKWGINNNKNKIFT